MDSIIPQDDASLKKCSKCEKEFPFTSEFFSHSRWGLRDVCKTCDRESRKQSLGIEPAPDGYKRCSICKEPWPATHDFFTYCEKSPDKLNSGCKKCRYERKNAKRNTPEGKAKEHQYYLDNIEQFQRRDKEWHRTHKQESRIRHRRNRHANIDRYRERDRQYYQTEAGQASRKRRAKNHMQSEHGSLVRKAHNHTWRARKRNAEGTHTAEDIKQQYDRQKGKCYYCGCKIGLGKHQFHVDHIVPLSRGGSDGPDNICITCPTCNLKKRNKLPHEFFEGGRLL